MAIVNLKKAVISVIDDTGTQILKIGDGTLTFSEKRAIEYVSDRGWLDEARLGPPEPMDVSIDCVWLVVGSASQTFDGSGTPTTVSSSPSYDKLFKGDPDGTPRTSIDPDTTRPYACNIQIVIPLSDGLTDRTILLKSFRAETGDFDLSAGTMKVSGKCMARRAQQTEA